jgi:hypothetical protein
MISFDIQLMLFLRARVIYIHISPDVQNSFIPPTNNTHGTKSTMSSKKKQQQPKLNQFFQPRVNTQDLASTSGLASTLPAGSTIHSNNNKDVLIINNNNNKDVSSKIAPTMTLSNTINTIIDTIIYTIIINDNSTTTEEECQMYSCQ